MKSLFALLCTALYLNATPVQAAAFSASESNGITHFVEEVATPSEDIRFLSTQHPVRSFPSGVEELVIIEKIINLGQKVWTIIEKNKPVVDVRYSYANALPQGVKSGADLEKFSDLNFRSYRMYGKNLFGITVYDLTYTLVHRYGGTYKGRGRYLENVTVLPHQLDVAWGYTVGFAVTNVSQLNAGTSADPIGALSMELHFHVSTVLKSSDYRSVFGFRGDSASVRTIQ